MVTFPHAVTQRNFLSLDECARVVELGSRLALRAANLENNAEGGGAIRASEIIFLPPGAEFGWLFDRIRQTVLDVNNKVWKFELTGAEHLQFARYRPGGHYIWHMDLGLQNPNSCRKLSFTVQLSDPAGYTGGDLEFQLGSATVTTASREQGAIVMFPSYIMHRVAPVTEGERYSLVQWLSGDTPFR